MIRDLGTLVVDMLLFCPSCGTQHIDSPERSLGPGNTERIDWDNPPHRSHLCQDCGHIWRPSDVHTNGVATLRSKGVNDSTPIKPVQFSPWRGEWERSA